MSYKRKIRLKELTILQETHLYGIQKEFCSLVDKKYRKGVKEHGGNLWNVKSVKILDFAIDEAIDQVVYLLTLKHQMAGNVFNPKSR